MIDQGLRPVGEPFVFEWYVDTDGYEIEEIPPGRGRVSHILYDEPPLWLRRKGGAMKPYRPLEEAPGLFLEFSQLRPEPEAFLEFANKYGFLGTTLGTANWEGPESLDAWSSAHTNVASFVQMIDDTLRLGHEPWIHAPAFNERFAPLATVRLTYHRGKVRRQVVPRSLLSAIILQLMSQVETGIKFRQCRHCGTWFPYGHGTPNRRNKEYCSGRCKVAWHRENREAST